MYAVIKTGGKQYIVREGQTLKVEKINASEGEDVLIDVLMLKNDDGSVIAGDDIKDKKVRAKILKHGKGKKIVVFKYKPKKHYQRKQGHRQQFTEIRIEKLPA